MYINVMHKMNLICILPIPMMDPVTTGTCGGVGLGFGVGAGFPGTGASVVAGCGAQTGILQQLSLGSVVIVHPAGTES